MLKHIMQLKHACNLTGLSHYANLHDGSLGVVSFMSTESLMCIISWTK